MGAGGAKEHVIIEISYCGGCGWTKVVQQLCDSVRAQLPKATIDCRPEDKFTGVLEASLIINKAKKKKIFTGDKEKASKSMQKITQDIVQAYDME